MEATNSQNAAIPLSPHPSPLFYQVSPVTVRITDRYKGLIAVIAALVWFPFAFKQEHHLEVFLQLGKSSHYSLLDRWEWSVNACWKKGRRKCGRSTRRRWLPNWQVGTLSQRQWCQTANLISLIVVLRDPSRKCQRLLFVPASLLRICNFCLMANYLTLTFLTAV